MKTIEELVELALCQVGEDRKAMKKLYMELDEMAEKEHELLGKAAISEQLVSIVTSLTKQTAQIVELAKICTKSTVVKKSSNDDDGEFSVDEIYNEISDIKN